MATHLYPAPPASEDRQMVGCNDYAKVNMRELLLLAPFMNLGSCLFLPLWRLSRSIRSIIRQS